MGKCYVPGCLQKSTKSMKKRLLFFSLPSNKERRLKWLELTLCLALPPSALEHFAVCSKHFASGRPSKNHESDNIDWLPNRNLPVPYIKDDNMLIDIRDEYRDENVQNIILKTPKIKEQFDSPDYIKFEQTQSEKRIECDLIEKYMTVPICDEHGFYSNDHDYLGLPVLHTKTQVDYRKPPEDDHSYALNEPPACLYLDLTHFCNICPINCHNLFIFNRHLVAHTVQNEVTCKFCNQTFFTSTCLNSHIGTRHLVQCDKCGNQVPTVQLKSHKKANALQIEMILSLAKYNMKPVNKVFFCVYCMKTMYKASEFVEHMSLHKKNKKPVLEIPAHKVTS